MVELLLTSNADEVDMSADDGTTPLLSISRTSDFARIAATLIEAGADVDHANNRGLTPVHAAASDGNCGILQVLLEAGARSTNIVFDSYSPLHAAVLGDHRACVELLTGFRPDMPGWTTFLAGAMHVNERARDVSAVAPRKPPPLVPTKDLRPGVPRADLEVPARALLGPAPEGWQVRSYGARDGRGSGDERRGEAAAGHDGAAERRRGCRRDAIDEGR